MGHVRIFFIFYPLSNITQPIQAEKEVWRFYLDPVFTMSIVNSLRAYK